MKDDLTIAINEIEMNTPIEVIAELDDKLAMMQRRIKEHRAALSEKMIAYIKQNGPIEWPIDDAGNVKRFWLGHDKSTKCRDTRKAMEFLLGLDLDSAADCLSANAWKFGAFKKALKAIGEESRYAEFFEVVTKDKLESGEAAPLELQTLDTKFLT